MMTQQPSQADLILEELEAHRGDYVGMPRLVEVSGSYNVHSRIADLRARGVEIENHTERHGRTTKSYYRIPVPDQGVLF